MKRLARRTFWKLGETGLFQSKPHLAPLLRTLWRYLFARTPQAGEAAIDGLAANRLTRYPILFHDRHDLDYLLYPGQNAEIFLANNGNYEIDETDFCLAHLRPGMIVFDVGANIGLYTLLFAKHIGPAGRVHAFEPEPRNYRQLVVNLAINGFENVTANLEAVYAQTQPVTLNIFPVQANALHSLRQSSASDPLTPGKTFAPEQQATVPAVSLDDYAAQHGIESIDYLKVDVEGAEIDVLRGARGLFERGAVALVQYEALKPTDDLPNPENVFAFLRGYDFHCHAIESGGKLSRELAGQVEENSNYVAVKQ